MNQLKKILSLILLLLLFIGCNNEAIQDVEEASADSRQLIGTATPEKVEKANEMIKNLSDTRVPLNYVGQLCPDEVSTGETSVGSLFNFDEVDIWSFTADAGDIVTFEVNRTDCNSDPRADLWYGFGDSDDLLYFGFIDDEQPPACEPDCFAYGDPYFENFEIPLSGTYTIAVGEWGFAECVVGPMTYEILLTGINTCFVNIDGCDSGVVNQIVGASNMDELIDELEAGEYRNHGQFVRAVAALVNGWFDGGLITQAEKDAIMACAGQSGYPY